MSTTNLGLIEWVNSHPSVEDKFLYKSAEDQKLEKLIEQMFEGLDEQVAKGEYLDLRDEKAQAL